MNADRLRLSYFNWYQSEIRFCSLAEGVVKIDLPFADRFRDEITVYAVPQSDGQVLLTDDGWSTDNLQTCGGSLAGVKGGVHLDGITLNDDGDLSVTVPSEQVPQAIHQLLQVMITVNGIASGDQNN